jgi:Zn-dependent metalloprotease
MVFGDGDVDLFQDFTRAPDVVAHELTHGVIQYTAKLPYDMQPGALNGKFSSSQASTHGS